MYFWKTEQTVFEGAKMRINLGSGDYPELVISLGDLTKEVPIVRIYNNRSNLLSFASIVESKQTPELIQLIESFQVKVL